MQACFRWYEGSISFIWYLLNHRSFFRRSWWFMAPTGCLQCGNRWVWEDCRGPHCNTDSIQLPDGPDLFPTVKNLWCGARPVACARPKSKRTQACTLGCTSRADIWRACSANQRKHQKSPARLFFTRQMEGLTRDDPLAGAPVFHVSLAESEQASLTTGKRTGGLWSWPLWVSRAFVLVLGELNSKKATPFGRGLERALKSGTTLCVWERRLSPLGGPRGMSGFFRFRRCT